MRVRLRTRPSVLAPLLTVLFVGTGSARASTVVVGPSDGTCPDAIFSRVQSAIDASVPGTTIVLCPGTYAEQLLLTKRVRLIGSPGTRLVPPALTLRTTSLRTGRTVA